MMFADLCVECDKMREDLKDEWVPECFDRFFVAIGAGEDFGGLLGYDSYEQDYFGLSCSDVYAEDKSKKALKQLTKDDLIAAARQCLRIYQSYIALSYRYDCLKTAMDILRDQNTGSLQMVNQIEEVYEKANSKSFGFEFKHVKKVKRLDEILKKLPDEAWLQ